MDGAYVSKFLDTQKFGWKNRKKYPKLPNFDQIWVSDFLSILKFG